MVRFNDKHGSQALRQSLLAAHLQWLERYQAVVLVAGSLRREPGDTPVGACWVVEAEDKSKVSSLLETDPFWIGGLRESYEILHWSKAFPERKVPI